MNISLTLPGIILTIVVVVILVKLIQRFLYDANRATKREDEAQLIQDLFQGLQRMEKRIDALETILLDRERTESQAKTKTGER